MDLNLRTTLLLPDQRVRILRRLAELQESTNLSAGGYSIVGAHAAPAPAASPVGIDVVVIVERSVRHAADLLPPYKQLDVPRLGTGVAVHVHDLQSAIVSMRLSAGHPVVSEPLLGNTTLDRAFTCLRQGYGASGAAYALATESRKLVDQCGARFDHSGQRNWFGLKEVLVLAALIPAEDAPEFSESATADQLALRAADRLGRLGDGLSQRARWEWAKNRIRSYHILPRANFTTAVRVARLAVMDQVQSLRFIDPDKGRDGVQILDTGAVVAIPQSMHDLVSAIAAPAPPQAAPVPALESSADQDEFLL